MESKSDHSNPDTSFLGFRVKVKKSILFFGGIITLLGVAVTFYIANSYSLRVELRDYVALFSAGMIATTLFYHAKNLELNYMYNKERLEFDKMKYEEEKDGKSKQAEKLKSQIAYEILADWYKPGMAENVQTCRDFLKSNKPLLADHKPIHSFIEELEKDKTIRKTVISILNFFEHLSLLIQKGIIDEETVKSAFYSVFCDYYKVLKRFIEHHKGENKKYLCNWETICIRWING